MTQAHILLAGGSGFIGTRVAERLQARGQPFTILDTAPSAAFPGHSRQADIRDPVALVRASPPEAGVLVHLAAAHRDDIRTVKLYREVNVEGTRSLCHLAEARGISRILFLSSAAVYGIPPPDATEDAPLRPTGPYGRSKAEAEAVLRDWQAAAPRQRNLVILRPAVVFGPGNRGNLHRLAARIAAGRFVMVGRGRNAKSITHVDNLAALILHLIDKTESGAGPGTHVVNHADKPDLTMAELVARIRRATGRGAGMGLRLPEGLGLGLAGLLDAMEGLGGMAGIGSGAPPRNRDRLRKFMTATSLSSHSPLRAGFHPPVPLEEGLDAYLRQEFAPGQQCPSAAPPPKGRRSAARPRDDFAPEVPHPEVLPPDRPMPHDPQRPGSTSRPTAAR